MSTTPSTTSIDPSDSRLMQLLQGTLPLCERPFEALGQALGLSEDAVLERLRRLLAQGMVSHFGPLFSPALAAAEPPEPAFAALQVPAAKLQRDLITATRSGLPLLARPYEAVGAMVGASGEQVRTQLAQMLAQGLIERIGALPRDQPLPPAGAAPRSDGAGA